MFEKITQIFKIRDLRNKILFVLFIFAIFRLMANIPIPGIITNKEMAKIFFEQFRTFSVVNVFTGGALDKFSIVMLGLGPYITSTVILQLLTMIFPQLEKMYREEGEAGRQKFTQYGRILTAPLAALNAYGMLALFQKQGVIGNLSPVLIFNSVVTITAGAIFLMWLGELISEKGIGEGTSLLIFAGIIADFPTNAGSIYELVKKGSNPAYSYFLFFAMALIILVGVVIVNEARRNIPVSYAKRVRGSKMYGGVSTYLPLNINPAGVMPVIFALSILSFPAMIASFLRGFAGKIGTIAVSVSKFFENPWVYGGLEFFLVFLFTFFYTIVTFDPDNVSENLQKSGGFIPGIRPGASTAQFLSHILNRILPIGALFLAVIAIMPTIIGKLTKIVAFQFLVGGTSLLILVNVVLETVRQIKSQLEMREYETF
jgi:preprotein translocase subunit SecY